MELANKVKIINGLGVEPKDVTMEMGDTIRTLLTKNNMPLPNAKDIRVNGNPASLDFEIMPNDVVSFLPKIEGGLV